MMAVTMLLLGTGFVAVLAIKSNSIMGGMINGIKNAGNKLTAPAVNSLSSYAGAMAGAAKARRKSEIASRDYSKETERGKIASRRKWSPLKLDFCCDVALFDGLGRDGGDGKPVF